MLGSGDSLGHSFWWSWIRLPTVSENVAIFTGPAAVGGLVKATPAARSRV